MKQYLDLFIDDEYPDFIDKYLSTDTLERLKHVTQFCGCDYTRLYSPLFKYTRFDHSLVVAHMTWHFTHDKKETIAALLHDIGTPCFAHCIDYVFGDYVNQESSEKSTVDMIKKDVKLQELLKQDNLCIDDFRDYSNYHILENKSPKLCTDRLDGVLHSCYIWLHTHNLKQIKEVYNDLTILVNEDDVCEIGFRNIDVAEKFVFMVYNYAKALRENVNKYTMKYVSEIVKLAVSNGFISLNDLYTEKEENICDIFKTKFPSWEKFNNSTKLISTDILPKNNFYISFEAKKRNTIPLVYTDTGSKRINLVSDIALEQYNKLMIYKDKKFGYIEEIDILN